MCRRLGNFLLIAATSALLILPGAYMLFGGKGDPFYKPRPLRNGTKNNPEKV
jgi:hypothetical protein